MSEKTDPWEAVLERLLGESRALSREALRLRPGTGRVTDTGFAGRIARLRASLAAIGEDASSPSAGARLRLIVALSTLPGGERRACPRWPLARAGALRLGSRALAVTLLDLGRGGALLAPVEGLETDVTREAELVLGSAPPLAATIVADADRLPHLAFAPGAMAGATTLTAEIQDWETHYEAALWQTTALANDVQRLFEGALSDGVLTTEDIFLSGPPRAGAVAARLRALMAQARPASDDIAYVAATDRNGATACVPGSRDEVEGEAPGGSTAPDGVAIMDAVTLRAARFSDKALVQTYRRRPGQEPLGVVADLSAPVIVRGRHWGCVRIGRALPKAARA